MSSILGSLQSAVVEACLSPFRLLRATWATLSRGAASSNQSENSARISPTAYVTAQIWYARGLSDLRVGGTWFWVYRFFFLPLWFVQHYILGWPSYEDRFVLRHLVIDDILEQEIESGRVGTIVELACGLSGRGLQFASKYPELTYIESDLENIVNYKKKLISSLKPSPPPNHHLLVLDALNSSVDSPQSLLGPMVASILSRRPSVNKASGSKASAQGDGIAVVSEGLLYYLSQQQSETLYANIKQFLEGNSRSRLVDGNNATYGLYVADCNSSVFRELRSRPQGFLTESLTRRLLSRTYGSISGTSTSQHEHVERDLKEIGFASATLLTCARFAKARKFEEKYVNQHRVPIFGWPKTTMGVEGITDFMSLWVNVVVAKVGAQREERLLWEVIAEGSPSTAG